MTPDTVTPPAEVLARLEAELAAETRGIRRWAAAKVREREAAYAKRLARYRRATAEARLLAERARHTLPADDPVSFVLQHFADRIVAMDAAGMALDLHRLARWTPWQEWIAWEADPMNAAVLAAYKAHTQNPAMPDPRASARSSVTAWGVSSTVPFPDGVPLLFLDSFALIMATHRADLRRLIAQRWHPKRKQHVLCWPVARWPWPLRAAVATVGQELDLTPLDVIARMLCTPQTSPPVAVPAARPSYKMRQRTEAERILGDRCVDCGRTRADGVDLHLDEVDGLGGGRRREAQHRTYGLRAEVITYARAHGGRPPKRVVLRCASCHGFRHRLAALAAEHSRRQAQ